MPTVSDPNLKISPDKDVPSAHTLASELKPEELEALRTAIRSVRDLGLKGEHIEIGTAAGGTLVQMLKTFAGGPPPPFWVVDTMTYFHDQLATVKRNLSNNGLDPEAVRFFTMMSGRAFIEVQRNPPRAAFLFIDADHELHGVTRDLQWTCFLQPQGILCMHDYGPGDRLNGVTLAADRFLKRNPHFEKLGLTGSLLVLQKTRTIPRLEVSEFEVYRAEVLRQWVKLKRSFWKRWQKVLKK